MTEAPPLTLDPELLRRAAGQAVVALKALAHEDRLLLLCQLSQGELCVGELEERLGLRQPSLSQQLGVLRTQGVVGTRRQGKNVYYRRRRSGAARDPGSALPPLLSEGMKR